MSRFASTDFKKISRCTPYHHDKSVYQKSGWYLKALKSYPFFKMNRHADNDNDAYITGGWIIVCTEFLIPSQTKITEKRPKKPKNITVAYRTATDASICLSELVFSSPVSFSFIFWCHLQSFFVIFFIKRLGHFFSFQYASWSWRK